MSKVSKRCCWQFERSRHKRALPLARKLGRPTTDQQLSPARRCYKGRRCFSNAPIQVVRPSSSTCGKADYLRWKSKSQEAPSANTTGSAANARRTIRYVLTASEAVLAVSSLGQCGRRKITAIPQPSSKTILGLKRVFIRSFDPLPTMRKAAARAALSGMEES